ncbi:hypothetical protein PV755_00150 [Streptomyces caniscabiei]|uniref:DUF6907 domain-containing protein n=1 Tax=Streptomyces caniscabiei TaxID=2746961 RepID=UPI0029B2989D|nr:hypothetical protein [Streptomyces caniscabiei]MDX3507345.1 hypothetical protein [Streptomyces caniscabiei]
MSPEEERAQRSVERAFPDVARFLGQLPVYGPTGVENDNDDTGPAEVVVRVDFLMSREELAVAFAYGYAETNTGRDPGAMTVQEVRREVEGYLAGTSYVQFSRHIEEARAGSVPADRQAAFDAALQRAYPGRVVPEPPAVQAPRYGDGTVTLQTLDAGEVTVPEPAWCTGHEGETVGHLADITHNGPHTTVTARTEQYGTVDILDARISHAPHARQQPERHPVVSARLDIELDLTVEDAKPVTHALHVAGLRLARLAADTRHLRGGTR